MSMVIDFLDQAGFTDEATARLMAELALVEATDDERFKDGGMLASSPTASAMRPWPRSLRSPSSTPGPATRLRREPLSGSRSQSPRSQTYWKSQVLAGVVDIQIRQGDFAGALVTARVISRADIAGEARNSIAARQAREGDAAPSLECASRLEPPDQKAFAFIGIAEGIALHKADARKGEPRKP
jgi:hypothetical protein